MRILIITGSFYPALEGGPTNALYWLASGLARCGYSVRVLATDKYLNGKYPSDTWIEMNDFCVIYRSNNKHDAIESKELSECDCLIRSGVSRIKAHIVNVRMILQRKKVIISPRGELFYPAIFHKGKAYGILKLLFLRFFSVIYGRRAIFHATSPEEEAQIHKIMGRCCSVVMIPNLMILPPAIHPDIVDSISNYFVYVGRIAPIKALDKLMEALARSSLFFSSNMILRIVGNNKGQYYDDLLCLIEKLGLSGKIVFNGELSGREKDEVIADAKYLFLVSNSENFGNVVIESLAQGTPVVASKGTPWKMLSDHHAGYWVDNDPKELSLIIDEIIKVDSRYYLSQRENAYNLAQQFDVFKNMGVWQSVLKKG